MEQTNSERKGKIMGNHIYLSEDTASILRSFNRTGERLISVLEDVQTTQEEIARRLAVNITAMKNLVVAGQESIAKNVAAVEKRHSTKKKKVSP